MRRQVDRVSRCAVACEVVGARGHLETVGRDNACLHARVVQRANAKQQVGALLQRVDITVGLLDVQLQLRIPLAQLPEPGCEVPLPEHHRGIDAHPSGGFALLFVQGLFGLLQLHQHQPRVVPEHAPGFGGADRAGVAVEQLLVQRLFHQLDLPGNRRRGQALAPGDFGKTAVVEHGDK
ncbi:hypothetical protein D3C73_895610 [compost metagenome]